MLRKRDRKQIYDAARFNENIGAPIWILFRTGPSGKWYPSTVCRRVSSGKRLSPCPASLVISTSLGTVLDSLPEFSQLTMMCWGKGKK